jgi:hypothetical protein
LVAEHPIDGRLADDGAFVLGVDVLSQVGVADLTHFPGAAVELRFHVSETQLHRQRRLLKSRVPEHPNDFGELLRALHGSEQQQQSQQQTQKIPELPGIATYRHIN